MIIANAGQALSVILIPLVLFFDYNNILLIGCFAFIRSTLFQPAFNSFIPLLFHKKHLIYVNALLATSGQLAWMFGPFLAGVLVLIFFNYESFYY